MTFFSVKNWNFDKIFCRHVKKNRIYHTGKFHNFMNMESIFYYFLKSKYSRNHKKSKITLKLLVLVGEHSFHHK